MKLIFSLTALLISGCSINRHKEKVTLINAEIANNEVVMIPPIVVYKTKNNYNNLVPISLSEDKKQIISFPHPKDLKVDGVLQTPSELHNGYLLDNRGIGQNVAFIKLSYREYANLNEAPSPEDLFNLIIDYDPLIFWCNCKRNNSNLNLESQLNEMIDNDLLQNKCEMVK
jgi:hypothetical protein